MWTIFKTIKNYCRKKFSYSVKTGSITDPEGIVKFLSLLGHESYPVTEKSYSAMHKETKFNKALVLVKGAYQEKGHAIAWSGSHFYDPAVSQKKPYNDTKFQTNYLKYGGDLMIIVIKTPLAHRFINMIKFYSLRAI